jgi:penicillin-binding protein 1A
VTSLLEGVVERTLPRVFSGFDRSLAGKTNDAKELWFIGSTHAAPIVRNCLEQALASKPGPPSSPGRHQADPG